MCDYTTLVFSISQPLHDLIWYHIGVTGEWTFEEKVERLGKDAHRLHLFILYSCFSNKSVPELQFEQMVAFRFLGAEIHDRIIFYFSTCCLWESILRPIACQAEHGCILNYTVLFRLYFRYFFLSMNQGIVYILINNGHYYYYYSYWHNTISASTTNKTFMTWPECRMQGAQCQAALEVLQGFPAPALQQQQPSYMEVVLPAVRTQRPGVQVLHQGPVDTALFIPHSCTAILQQQGRFNLICHILISNYLVGAFI